MKTITCLDCKKVVSVNDHAHKQERCPDCQRARYAQARRHYDRFGISECACGRPAVMRFQGEKVCARCRVMARLAREQELRRKTAGMANEPEPLESLGWQRFASAWQLEERTRHARQTMRQIINNSGRLGGLANATVGAVK